MGITFFYVIAENALVKRFAVIAQSGMDADKCREVLRSVNDVGECSICLNLIDKKYYGIFLSKCLCFVYLPTYLSVCWLVRNQNSTT